MKNAVTYLTRRCPRDCAYCSIRDAKDVGKELTPEEWIKAFDILNELGCTFNLILGNEPWLLGEKLITIFKNNKVPFGMYTSCPEPIYSRYRRLLFDSGVIDNLSVGIDYPITVAVSFEDDSVRKSRDVWTALLWAKENYPTLDLHAAITVHKLNYKYLPELTTHLSDIGVFSNVNFIHWNIDGKYDFCSNKEEIPDLLFTEEDLPNVIEVVKETLKNPGLIQNPEYLQMTVDKPSRILMGWHCGIDPMGGPTVDSDGTLRVCGYRKGRETPKLSIFDLPAKEQEWKEAVAIDAQECPGCIWSCPSLYHYWKDKDPEMGKLVYTNHAGTCIPKDKWNKRSVQ